jgi:hypothetical protein
LLCLIVDFQMARSVSLIRPWRLQSFPDTGILVIEGFWIHARPGGGARGVWIDAMETSSGS